MWYSHLSMGRSPFACLFLESLPLLRACHHLVKIMDGTKKMMLFSPRFLLIFSIFFSMFEKSSMSLPRACHSFMTRACLDNAGIVLQKHWILDYFFHTHFAWKKWSTFLHSVFFMFSSSATFYILVNSSVIFHFSEIYILYQQGFTHWKTHIVTVHTSVPAMSLLLESKVAPFCEILH